MLKQAWRSYCLSFHPSSIKKAKSSEHLMIWRLIVVFIILNLFREWDIWIAFLHVLPMSIISWSSMDCGIRLEKKMFLSPIKKQDREAYIRYLLLFKIGVPIFLGFLVEIIRGFTLGIDIWGSIGKLLCYLFAGIGTYIHADGIDKTDGRIVPARKDKNGKLKWSWMNAATHFGGVVAIIEYDTSYASFVNSKIPAYILSFCVVLLFIWSVIILATQYRPMIEYVTDYDRVSGLCIKDKYIEKES